MSALWRFRSIQLWIELSDIVTAVSEAVTNSIIHGYGKSGKSRDQCLIRMECLLYRDAIEVTVTDQGCGIEDIQKAREPLYTSSPEMERSGMGFTIMESFTDHFSVESEVGKGTVITLYKIFRSVGARRTVVIICAKVRRRCRKGTDQNGSERQ